MVYSHFEEMNDFLIPRIGTCSYRSYTSVLLLSSNTAVHCVLPRYYCNEEKRRVYRAKTVSLACKLKHSNKGTELIIFFSLGLCSPFLSLYRIFSFLILYTVGRTIWTGDQPVARPLPTQRTTQTQNRCTQTSMPRVGFECTTPVFERAKMVHALGRAAIVIGEMITLRLIIIKGSLFAYS
jgi:hypothetical protein